ncbi:MAG: caspase family protein [Spirulinaceae cyanobacterium]
MVQLSRRNLLQGAGATLATWGLHQTLDRHQNVLAQSGFRKLALLVGIDKYDRAPLGGCVNDTLLQLNLLVHRFGFKREDVVLLWDEDATREGILTAFEDHLIKQAKPGDVAFFHYSGHGALVRDPDAIFTTRRGEGVNGTLVPVDGRLSNPDGSVQDIMGRTLFLLMSALQTENFTAVLDSCHAAGADRPELTVRSLDSVEASQIDSQEQAYQQRWLNEFGWSEDDFADRRQRGIAKGVVLSGADALQLAVDEPHNGFKAGAFTYRLTQHLWQQNTSPAEAIAHVNRIMPTHFNQTPQLEAKPGSDNANQPMLFMTPSHAPADAVVKLMTENEATVMLVGVNPETVNAGTILTTRNQRGQVVVTKRQAPPSGFLAVGRVTGRLREGDLLRVQR